MSKITNTLTKNFTTLPNALIQDDNLSDRARFLFVYMATKPADWTFYQGPLSRALKWHKQTLKKYLDELIESGWITNEGQEMQSGFFGANNYILNSSPCTKKPATVKKSPCTKFSVTEKISNGKTRAHTKERLLQNKDLYK